MSPTTGSDTVSRRDFLQLAVGGMGALAWGLAAPPAAALGATSVVGAPAGAAALAGAGLLAGLAGAPGLQTFGPDEVAITLRVNGADRAVTVDPRTTLLDALRERLGLTGTKKGCNQGACGACTVLVDGRRMNACLTLAVMQDGREVTSIEGIARGDELHPLQQAFIRHDAFQCGYCTPGQIVSAVALLAEAPPTSDADIRERMNGNLCRCSAYPNIVAAIREVAGLQAAEPGSVTTAVALATEGTVARAPSRPEGQT